jgi:hypothetical protein
MVNHGATRGDRSHASFSWGMTADAENQVDIDKTSVIASNTNARHRSLLCTVDVF